MAAVTWPAIRSLRPPPRTSAVFTMRARLGSGTCQGLVDRGAASAAGAVDVGPTDPDIERLLPAERDARKASTGPREHPARRPRGGVALRRRRRQLAISRPGPRRCDTGAAARDQPAGFGGSSSAW